MKKVILLSVFAFFSCNKANENVVNGMNVPLDSLEQKATEMVDSTKSELKTKADSLTNVAKEKVSKKADSVANDLKNKAKEKAKEEVNKKIDAVFN